jgi:hypothetical protein
MENITHAIENLERDIKAVQEKLNSAFIDELTTRQYRKLLNELIELNNAKFRLECKKSEKKGGN